jgi:hypothetical protein
MASVALVHSSLSTDSSRPPTTTLRQRSRSVTSNAVKLVHLPVRHPVAAECVEVTGRGTHYAVERHTPAA